MRINAYIASCGVASRRGAEELIQKKRVKVNGESVTDLSLRVAPGDEISVDGKQVRPLSYVYVMFNKPAGVTVTRKDRFAVKTVYDYLPGRYSHLFPVGRLDKNSRGLLVLTNDGELCYRLTHPGFRVEKEYLVKISGKFVQEDAARILRGVQSGDDCLRVKKLKIEEFYGGSTLCRVIATEGKKRHLRRIFSELDFKVKDLVRLRVAKLSLGELKSGEFRVIDVADIFGQKKPGR